MDGTQAWPPAPLLRDEGEILRSGGRLRDHHEAGSLRDEQVPEPPRLAHDADDGIGSFTRQSCRGAIQREHEPADPGALRDGLGAR